MEGKENIINWAIDVPLAYVKGIVAENKGKGVWFGLKEGQSLDSSFDRTIIDDRVANRNVVQTMEEEVSAISAVSQSSVGENTEVFVGQGI